VSVLEDTVHSRGVSQILASLILITITLGVGFGLFGYVNSAVTTAERTYADALQTQSNQLLESFIIASANFSSNELTIWFLNNGNINSSIIQIIIWNSTSSLFVTYNDTFVVKDLISYPASSYEDPVLPLFLRTEAVTTITLTLPTGTFNDGRVYNIKALGTHGNTYTYFQVK